MFLDNLKHIEENKNIQNLLLDLEVFIKTEESLSAVTEVVLFLEQVPNQLLERNLNLCRSIWIFLRKVGKIKLSEKYAEIFINNLFKYKRIPQLKIFIIELMNNDFNKNKLSKLKIKLEILEGEKRNATEENLTEINDWHEYYWSTHQDYLKLKIKNNKTWGATKVKDIYEYILKYHLDKDIALELVDKILEKVKYKNDFLNLLKVKKIKIEVGSKKYNAEKEIKLKIDYDQLAYEFISGLKKDDSIEEKRIIQSLELMSHEEYITKGPDMAVAFSMLGMNDTVIFMCERLLDLELSQKQKISLAFIKAQALIETKKYYEACSFTQDVIRTFEINQNELLAFNYLLFQASASENKVKDSLMYLNKIYKVDKNYRDVSKRLMELEKNK